MATSGASPYGFVLFDASTTVAGPDLLYVADDRNAASGGGIQKWTFNGTTWTLATTFSVGGSVGARGVTGYLSGSIYKLFATTTETAANRLIRLDDDGINPPTPVTLSTAALNTVYRGVALAPQ